MDWAAPVQASTPPTSDATPSLAEVLNPDGTLRTGASGSFSAKGFRMGTGPDGRPVFKAAGITGAGDERWKNGFGPQGLNGVVNAVATNGSEVYVGGDFTAAGSVSASRVAKWNGSSWSSLGTGIVGSVLALAADGNGSLYAGGTFTQAGGVAVSNIAKWNGNAWSALGSGTSASVYALLAQGADVYVGGQFNAAGGLTTGPLAKWNGSAWSAVGNGLSGTVRALAGSGGNLYAGGSLGLAGTTVPVARWNGTAWSALGNTLSGTAYTLAATPNGTVYAGGDLSISGASVRNLVRWNGTAWRGVGTAWSGTVRALAIVGPALYVGGSFTQAGGGGVPANNIAKWNGTRWSSLGTGLNGTVLALAGSGGNVLHAGGSFTAVGDGSKLTTRYGEYSTLSEAPMVIDPMSGAVGETVTITGWDLAGVTAVTFNGTNAPGFTLSADEYTITVNVPAGTTNGPISVALPSGAATSSGSFTLMRAGAAAAFPFAGTPRVYTVPAGATDLRVVALGASRSYVSATTGRGARVTARLRVVPGEVLTIVAGGSGGEPSYSANTPGAGGYNGGGIGGASGFSPFYGTSQNPGHGGSGASDVRRIAGARSSSPLGGGTLAGTLGSRLLIAGGAGGRDGNADANGAGNANEGGKAGTALTGGAGGTTSSTTAGGGASGTLGSGGSGGRGDRDFGGEGGSGGGGGYYGGGGGAGSTYNSISGGSGGGGSSYVVPSELISGTTSSVGLGSHEGHGSLVLTPYYFVPMLASFTPLNGQPGNTSVTITGSYFTGATSVSFNGIDAPGFTVNAAGTQITLMVPSGATTGPISVTTAGGTATSTSSYTVGPGLAIASFTPTSGPVGTSVTITGSEFTGATAVSFNSTAASSFAVNSPTSITATVASGSTSGPISVTAPSGTATSSASFTVVPAPAIASFTPANGPVGTSVTITGSHFTGATAVTFNGTPAPGFVVSSGTQLSVSVPAGASTGPISVTTSGGTATSTASFTVTIPDLTVSTTQTISGTYNNITISGAGVATLGGALTVNGTLLVQAGGQLLTACQLLTGPGSFVLAAGATLGICDAAGISASGSTGAVQLSGNRSFSDDARYLYNGTVAQTSGPGLPASVREMTLTNGAGLTLTQDLALTQVLRLNSGELRLGGRVLTLRSSAAGTALLVNAGGTVRDNTGTCRMERYIDPSLNPGAGYRHFSSPVSGMPASALAATGFAPVLNQAYNTSAAPGTVSPFPNVFGYEGSRLSSSPAAGLSDFEKGWFVPAAADVLAQATGYTVNLPATTPVTFSGPSFYQGASQGWSQGSSALTETPWVLVGNPYPSPFDLSVNTATTSVNLDAARYVFESTSQYDGQYRAYVNGVGNGSPLLAAGQGFFVHKSAPNALTALGFNSVGRATSFGAQAPFRRVAADTRPQVQLQLRAQGLSDQVYVYAETGATTGIDVAFDAVKLANSSGLNLGVETGTTQLAIQGLPTLTAGTVLPLLVQVPGAGTVSFGATLANLPAGLTAYLHDAVTGARQDLSLQPVYAFTALQAGTLTGRFALVFSPTGSPLSTTKAVPKLLALYPNPARRQATLSLPAQAQARTVALIDMLGRAVRGQVLPAQASTAVLDLQGLPPGVYTVRCGSATAKLVVE